MIAGVEGILGKMFRQTLDRIDTNVVCSDCVVVQERLEKITRDNQRMCVGLCTTCGVGGIGSWKVPRFSVSHKRTLDRQCASLAD